MAVKNNLKLIFSQFKLNLKKEWQYKTSFFMQIIMMVFNDLFLILQWIIVFGVVNDIGGYGFYETMLLLAVSAGGYGFAHMLFNGAWNIRDMVYDGKLDVYLTQPKNVLINVCSSSTEIAAIGDIIYSFVVLVLIKAPWHSYLLIIPAMILAGLLYTALHVSFISLSFWINRGDAVAKAVEGTIMKAGNYPPGIFSGVTKWLFFTIIPTFFYTFIPVQYMLLSLNIWWILIFVAVVCLWVALAFFIFHKGLKRYNSGSLMGGRV